MQKLSLFLTFLWMKFAKGKVFTVTSCAPWKDQNDNIVGSRIMTAITQDDTDYGIEGVSNIYERVTFKIPKVGVVIPIGATVEPLNPVATVYGQYRNQLSVKADDVRVVGQPSGGKS